MEKCLKCESLIAERDELRTYKKIKGASYKALKQLFKDVAAERDALANERDELKRDLDRRTKWLDEQIELVQSYIANCNALQARVSEMENTRDGLYADLIGMEHRLGTENDILRARLHLAEQDRDSWKRDFVTTRDAANAHVEKLEARVVELESQVDTLSYHGPSDYAKLKARHGKLRAALEKIATLDTTGDYTIHMSVTAAEALADDEESE